MSEQKHTYSADDRGNVVDFYCEYEDGSTERVAVLNREAEVCGLNDVYEFVDDGGGDELMAWANENNYGEQIEHAIRLGEMAAAYNACANLKDPAAAIGAMKEALEKALKAFVTLEERGGYRSLDADGNESKLPPNCALGAVVSLSQALKLFTP